MTSKKLDSGESGLLTDENVFKEETAQMTEGKSSKYVEVTSDEPALVSVSCTYKGTKYSALLYFRWVFESKKRGCHLFRLMTIPLDKA